MADDRAQKGAGQVVKTESCEEVRGYTQASVDWRIRAEKGTAHSAAEACWTEHAGENDAKGSCPPASASKAQAGVEEARAERKGCIRAHLGKTALWVEDMRPEKGIFGQAQH